MQCAWGPRQRLLSLQGSQSCADSICTGQANQMFQATQHILFRPPGGCRMNPAMASLGTDSETSTRTCPSGPSLSVYQVLPSSATSIECFPELPSVHSEVPCQSISSPPFHRIYSSLSSNKAEKLQFLAGDSSTWKVTATPFFLTLLRQQFQSQRMLETNRPCDIHLLI